MSAVPVLAPYRPPAGHHFWCGPRWFAHIRTRRILAFTRDIDVGRRLCGTGLSGFPVQLAAAEEPRIGGGSARTRTLCQGRAQLVITRSIWTEPAQQRVVLRCQSAGTALVRAAARRRDGLNRHGERPRRWGD